MFILNALELFFNQSLGVKEAGKVGLTGQK